MSGDDIRAYVLLGCLVATYPAMLGVKAIEKSFGPEDVFFNSCHYKVVASPYINDGKTLEPLDKDSEDCIARQKKQDDENAVFNYQQARRKGR